MHLTCDNMYVTCDNMHMKDTCKDTCTDTCTDTCKDTTIFQQLCDTFQDYAPTSVLQVPPEEHVPSQAIFEYGELFVGNPIVYRFMTPNACHDNVLHLYTKGRILCICVGYALAADRKWRYHSWGLTVNQEIVETTAPFLLYFGCILQKC